MKLLDIKKGNQDILNKLKNAVNNLPLTKTNINYDNNLLFELYKELYNARHDILHYIILKMLDKPWSEEQQMSNYFDDIPEDMARKTPDIVFLNKNRIIIVDVSISYDVAKNEQIKKKKYLPIKEWVEKTKMSCEYIHVNIKNDDSNIELELLKLKEFQKYDFDMLFYVKCKNIINLQFELINELIDKEYFEKQKYEEFKNNINEDDDGLNKYFKDSIKYTNIGKYRDLDVDKEIFEKYNNGFITEDLIKSNMNDYNYQDTCNFFKRTLDDENSLIYKKHKDLTLEKEQFNDARENIKRENNKHNRRIPIPTLHIVLPFYEEEVHKDDDDINKTEQEKIIDFFDRIDIELSQLKGNFEHLNKFEFLYSFMKEFQFTIKDSKDKELNRNQFFNRNDGQSIRKNYYDLRNKLLFHDTLNKRKKITSKMMLDNNLYFDKNDTTKINEYNNEIKKMISENKWMSKKNLSFYDYMYHNGFVQEDKNNSMILENKRLKINLSKFSSTAIMGYKKSGVDYDLKDKNKNKNREIIDKMTIDFELDKDFDTFINELNKDTPVINKYKISDYMTTEYKHFDQKRATIMKENMTDNYAIDYIKIQNTQTFWCSRLLHNVANEMMHLTRVSSRKNTFNVLNAGVKNMVIIIANTQNRKNEDGQPFLCVWITKQPGKYNNIYGKIYKIPISKGFYLCITNWRRLNLNKLTFLRDVFYTTLSSTMNSVLSSPDRISYSVSNKLKNIYSFRFMVAASTNQKISELLMDTRYAYMSAFSIYTNINKLLIEKFGPPYYNIMELWIVKRLLDRLPRIHNEAKNGGFKYERYDVVDNVMDIKSIGGEVRLHSLWHDHIITDVTDLMDEIFVYVHTMKEPANIYHENVKAIRTILKFQKIYDDLKEKHQKGIINTVSDIEEFLKSDIQMGCSTGMIIDSIKYTINSEKPNMKKIIHTLNDENIGELLSTKAVIKDVERELLEVKVKKRDVQKHLNRMYKIYGTEDIKPEKENIKQFMLKTKSKYYGNKQRQKVMESVLEVLEENPKLTKTVDFAQEFIQSNRKVKADICIKSQYGSKREFYVVNIGAKTLARVTENFFKELCKNSPNEAISVPGDEKILRMQKMLDKVYHNFSEDRRKIVYVNGDCTKWSAAETMASFIAMCIGLREKITENMYQLLLSTYNAWSDKEIQVPMDIYNKVISTSKFNTTYLDDINTIKTATIRSTQNFLQGMFNYSSSYKAVCCTNYAFRIWKSIYKDSNLHIEHLEHSDDYMLIVLYDNIKELEKFRVLQKMVMRLHGYNDSDRKTSVQKYFMEFVSQISFNGVMLYPQIKKSKEVNLSLPCMSYKQDMESALSRVKECARVGCNQTFLYFFQKLHTYVVAEAYSILPGMYNNMGKTISELWNTPIEIFGIPNPLPIFSLYCRGNANNYRLYKYGDQSTIQLLYCLHQMAIDDIEKEDYLSDDIDYKYTLKSPTFSYEINNKTVKRLRRNLNINTQEIKDFWKNNISYKLLKPRNRSDLITWIKCMYYNKSFLEAYNSTSRTDMTMRISMFIKNKVILDDLTLENYNTPKNVRVSKNYTIQEYYKYIINEVNNRSTIITHKYDSEPELKNMLIKTITKCDPTFSAIYTFIEKTTINVTDLPKLKTVQVALKTPIKLKTFNIINSPGDILQFLYNKKNFEKDNRTLISRESLEKDINELRERIPEKILNSTKTMDLLSVYNDMMINKEKRIVMFGYNRHCMTLYDSIKDVLVFNYIPGFYCKVETKDIITVQDPMNEERLLFVRGINLTRDFHRQCLDNITLIYTYLNLKHDMPITIIKKYFDQIKFKAENNGKIIEMSYKDILKVIDKEYIETYSYNREEIKISCFLKTVLMDDYTLVNYYSKSIYAFSYKYLVEGYKSMGKYIGLTHVCFTYLNINCEVIHDESICSKPLVLINKYYETACKQLYNIALRLTSFITENEYDLNPNQDRITFLKKNDIQNLNKFQQKYQVTKFIIVGEKERYLPLNKITDNDLIYPFFITNKTLQRQGEKTYEKRDSIVDVNPKTMNVRIGKYKLFTLPFWCCHQYNNMRYINTHSINFDFIEGIYVQDLLDNTIIKKYLTNQLNIHNDKINISFNISEKYEYLKSQIPKNKIYDFEFKNFIKVKDKSLESIMNKKKTHFKDYEKNFILMNDVFLQKKQKKINNYEDYLKDPEKIIVIENKEEKNFFEEFGILDDINNDDIIDGEELFESNFDITTDIFMNEEDTNKYLTIDEVLPDMHINDDFLVYKPKKSLQNFEKTNYMIRKLRNKEQLTIHQLYMEKEMEIKYEYMTLPNILMNLNNYVKIHNISTKVEEKYVLLLCIFRLLCFVFITPENYYGSLLKFYSNNDELIFAKTIIVEYDDVFFEKITKSNNKKIINYKKQGNNIFIDLEIEYNEYMKIYKKEISENIVWFRLMNLSKEMMTEINNIKINLKLKKTAKKEIMDILKL